MYSNSEGQTRWLDATQRVVAVGCLCLALTVPANGFPQGEGADSKESEGLSSETLTPKPNLEDPGAEVSADSFGFLEQVRPVSLDSVAQRAIVRTPGSSMSVRSPGDYLDDEERVLLSRVLADRLLVRVRSDGRSEVAAWIFAVDSRSESVRFVVLDLEPPPGRLIRVPSSGPGSLGGFPTLAIPTLEGAGSVPSQDSEGPP